MIDQHGGCALYSLAVSAQEKAFRLAWHGQLASTNDEALARAREGDAGRLWIVADTQTKGRGRSGRAWSSPRGNLYASLLLIDPAPPHKAAELGFVCGVAAAQALRCVLSGNRRIAIKWPNDILHDGAKLCGILLEGTTLPDGRFACVAGIGVNCAAHPENTSYPATNLAAVSASAIPPFHVFSELSAAMAHWLDVWASGAGFEVIRAEWLALAAGLGTWISVARPTDIVEGTFKTIDAAGRLVLEQAGGELAVEAGDIFFSPRPNCVAATAGG